MSAMDFPDLGLLSPTRNFSASPLQSLILLNNPFVLHHAQATSERIAKETSDLDSQIQSLARMTFQREIDDRELIVLREYATKHGLAALCRMVFNSNEFLFIP
jgi:hypothetical protein